MIRKLRELPVYVDTAIPTNLGTGTNEDRIIVTRPADHILFEGVPFLALNLDAAGTNTLTA